MGDPALAEAEAILAVSQTAQAIDVQRDIIASLRALGQPIEGAVDELNSLEISLAAYSARLRNLQSGDEEGPHCGGA